MEAVYQVTIRVALAVLALVVPVFILTVTLLGRAIERARAEREALASQQKAALDKQIEQAKTALEKAKGERGTVPELKADLRGLGRELHKLSQAERQARRRVEWESQSLTLKGCVLRPGGLCLISIALTEVAMLLAGGRAAPWLWIGWDAAPWVAAVAALSSAIWLLLRSLAVVQEIALTSDEVSLKQMASAVKQALLDAEAARAPEVALEWAHGEPPFEVEAGKELALEFYLSLDQGTEAKVRPWILVPPEFTYKGKSRTGAQRAEPYKGHRIIFCGDNERTLVPGMRTAYTEAVVAPEKPGDYTLRWTIKGPQLDLDLRPFDVHVKAAKA